MLAQTLTITNWLPPPVLNGSRQKHWSVIRRDANMAKTTTWGAAKHAGWVFVPGRVRLTVTLVFGVKRRRDTDNTVARCKHLIDGLKGAFFEDDDATTLELVVRAVVEPGVKETRLMLEPA